MIKRKSLNIKHRQFFRVLVVLLMIISAGFGSSYVNSASNPEEKANGLLYKVKKGDKGEPSYLFGTLHIMKSGYLDKWAKVQKAYQASDKVIVETVIDSNKLREFGQMAAMRGQTLTDFYSEKEFETIKEHVKGNVQYPVATVKRFKPIQVSLILTMNEYNEIGSPIQKADGIKIDQYFARNGQKKGKEIIELEDFLEQGRMLYNEMPLKKQAKMLKKFVDKYSEMEEACRNLVKAYQKQDLQRLYEIYKSQGEYYNNMGFLIDERNKDWIKKAVPIFDEGDAFMAVGSLHLPGEKGLIAMLRERGFQVKPMSVK